MTFYQASKQVRKLIVRWPTLDEGTDALVLIMAPHRRLLDVPTDELPEVVKRFRAVTPDR